MNKYTCPKCDGEKNIRAFSHIQGGVCFKCGGSGFVEQKTAPTKARLFKTFFLWLDPSDANYMGGDFCDCGNIKAKSLAEAERKTKARMAANGSVDYKVTELAP